MRALFVLLVVLLRPGAGLCQDTGPAREDSGADTLVDTPAGEEDLSLYEDNQFLFEEEDELTIADPLQPLNRGIFWFNDKLYFYLVKPVARGYRRVAPEPLRIGVQNFFSNLAAPVRIVNAGLQGKFQHAGNETGRFLINTTIGIAGFFDTAKDHFDLREHNEDFGQTLGYYGVGPGIYLVLPILGPSNVRDGVGLFVDNRMSLLYFIWADDSLLGGPTYLALRAFDMVNELSLDKDTYEGIKRDALDPYLFVRDAFIQYRQNKIEN